MLVLCSLGGKIRVVVDEGKLSIHVELVKRKAGRQAAGGPTSSLP